MMAMNKQSLCNNCCKNSQAISYPPTPRNVVSPVMAVHVLVSSVRLLYRVIGSTLTYHRQTRFEFLDLYFFLTISHSDAVAITHWKGYALLLGWDLMRMYW